MRTWSLRITLLAAAAVAAAPAAQAGGVRNITVALVPYDAPSGQDLVADPYGLGTQITTLAQFQPGSQVYLEIWVTTEWVAPNGAEGLTGAGLDVYYQPETLATSTAQVDLNPTWGTLAYCPISEECVPVPGMVDDVGGNNFTGLPAAGMWSRVATIEFDVLQMPATCATFAAGQDGPMLFAYIGGGLADPAEITFDHWQIPGPFEDQDGDLAADCLDNCDLPNPDQGDCDGDGVGDVCTLADGAMDCNENVIPDVCDIADGTSDDLNMDGVPDECGYCESVAECADFDLNGVRDDICVWWTCLSNHCEGASGEPDGTPIVYGDLGGFAGACPPDGAPDLNDRFHALNCFGNQSTTGIPGQTYPCENNPPAAFNVDVASLGAACTPDGVCDLNDAFAAINAFSGMTSCSCPGGPAPGAPAVFTIVEETALTLRPARDAAAPGDTVEIDVFFDDALQDLRGYQLHVGVFGGRRGELVLEDIVIRPHKGRLFGGLSPWEIFNVATAQMGAGLDQPGVATPRDAYAATLIYRVGAEARGRFVVDLLHDLDDPQQRTYLFPTPADAGIAVIETTPAVIDVQPRRKQRGWRR